MEVEINSQVSRSKSRGCHGEDVHDHGEKGRQGNVQVSLPSPIGVPCI